MSRFKKWITKRLGYEPRNIDLALELGEERGDLVRKWMAGIAYPSSYSCIKLAQFLGMEVADVQREILKMKMDDLCGS